MSNVAEQIALYQRKLEKYANSEETDKILYYIHKLKHVQVTVAHLEETGVGRSVNALRHHAGMVGEKARALVNKWKMMVTAEEEEEEEEEGEEEEQPVEHSDVDRGGGREMAREEDEVADLDEDDEEDDERLQIEEDDVGGGGEEEAAGYQEDSRYGYRPTENSPSDGENGYNPYTSKQDYQMVCGDGSPTYEPTSTSHKDALLSSPDAPPWPDASPSGSHDRRNGSKSSKKSSREDKDKHKDKHRDKDRSKDKEDKDKKREHKDKHKHKHRDKDKERSSSHKDKHREKERNSDKSKGESSDRDKGKKMVNGFSTPEADKTLTKYDKDPDKRSLDEKHKEKSEKNKESRERHEGKSSKDRECTSKEASKDRDRRKEEKHKDKNSSRKDGERSERESKSSQREEGGEERRESKNKKSKKHEVGESSDFAAALMGLESPTKKKKKKKKKESREHDSSDDEQPSSSKGAKRAFAGGVLPDPKKPKLLARPPSLPQLPPSPGQLGMDDSFLPEITPNYKPLPRLPVRDDPPEYLNPKLTEEEALNIMFQTKNNRRSKMYSGKAMGLAYVPTLFDACIRVLQDNIDALEFTGGIPFDILRRVLERASPQQLLTLEDYNAYLLDDTDVLWEVHCKKDFKNKKLLEMETWREMWLRCHDERELKLKNLTEKFQQKFVTKPEPKRTTKLAFVDSACKVPKNVARAQAKYGTAAASSTAAKPGKANEVAARKTAMQNAQRAERAAPNPRPTAAKNKKVAPLMAKTRQFFKKAFRR